MPLAALVPIDTRTFFRPVSSDLVTVLRGLSDSEWKKPTVAGTWEVRDVVAHLLDTTLRRLSFHRDGHTPPPPAVPIASERDFVAFINGINAEWVAASKRLSPRILTDLYERASRELADWFESVPFEAPALFSVSWAGEQVSEGWFDIGREFTELWHHQQQIRMAVGADTNGDPRYLGAVINVAMRGLPHAFRDVSADTGVTVTIDVRGDAGGVWTLVRDETGWALRAGQPKTSTTTVQLNDDTAWQLLFNALPAASAGSAIKVEGRHEFIGPFVRARSIVI